MTTIPDPLARVRAIGGHTMQSWDYDIARAHAIGQINHICTTQPDLFRWGRRAAFDLRQELGEHLPGVPSEIVEKVTITLLAKVVAFAIGQAADPAPVLTAGSVATFAVLDEFWTTTPEQS